MKINTKNLFIIFISSLLFVSCNFGIKEVSTESQTITLNGYFSIKDAELYNSTSESLSDFSRAAFPTMPSSLTYIITATAAGEQPIQTQDISEPTTTAPGKFSIPLKAGIAWTITVSAKGSSQTSTQTPTPTVTLFEDSFDFTPSNTESSVTHDFYLHPLTTGNGKISLDLELEADLLSVSGNEDERISKITYEGFPDTGVTDFPTSPSTHNMFTLTQQAGTYSIIFKFYNSKGALLFATTQTINVYSDLITNTWKEGSSDLIKNNKFILTKALVMAYGSTDFYVDFSIDPEEPQYGTLTAPYKTISKAIEVINSITNTSRTYSIHVKNNLSNHETITKPIQITGNDISIECYANTPGDRSGTAELWLAPSSTTEAALFTNGAIIIKNGLKLILEGKNGYNGLVLKRNGTTGLNQGLPRCITIDDNSTFVMNGGIITSFNMTATGAQGAGVYIGSNGRFIMSGGKLTGNVASGDGGAVYISNSGIFAMSGGEISGNKVTSGNGGGIYLGGTLFLSGVVKIKENRKGTTSTSPKNNVYIPSGKTINVTGALSKGTNEKSEIWFTTEDTIAHPGEASKITITEGYDYKEEWSNNPELSPETVFKADSGNPVIFSYYNPSGWGQNPDAATDEVYIAYDGGNLFTAQDYNISMSGSSFSLVPNISKTVSVNFSATRKEADGTLKELYYKKLDRKFYTNYEAGTYSELAAGNNPVTWKKASLYTDNYKMADNIDVTISSGASQTLTVTIPPLDFEGLYTLKFAAEYLGTTYDYDLVFTCSSTPAAAASTISGLTASATIAIEGEVTGDDFLTLNKALRNSSIPSSVKVILDLSQTNISELYDTVHNATEPQSFINCSKLKGIILPSTLKKIGNSTFRWSGITTIDIPSSVTSIGDAAFLQSYLTEITIPSSVTSLGTNTFQMCAQLRRAVLNCSTTIPRGCFYGCTNLTDVDISENVRGFNENCFKGCTSLTTINYAGTIEQWQAFSIATDAFDEVPATVVHCSNGDVNLQ